MAKALVPMLDSDKVKAIKTNLGERTAFESNEKATAYEQLATHLESAAAKTENFYDVPVILGEGLETARRLVVSTVGVRDKGDKAKGIPARNGYTAIVAFVQPSTEEFLASESPDVKEFIKKVIIREATDVVYSGIRAAESEEDLQEVLKGLQITVEDIVANSRASAGPESSFEQMWSDFRRGFLKVKQPELEKQLPQKPDVLKAIRSKAYAMAHPVCVEFEKLDLWVRIAVAMVKAGAAWKDEDGKESPIDTSDLQEWIANRDTFVIPYGQPAVDVSKLAALDF